ncbi:DUF551 domain-containing protein [Escherichia coli]|nr:DUF551 domain-containing protein [Escherichia coli]
MTITKQRVEEIISRIEMYGHGAGYTAEEVYDLAVLALNLSNIANLKRYELDMEGCDSCGQDCGADMTEDSDGDYVLFDDVVKLFEFDTTTQKLEGPAKETTMSEIDYQALREIAKQATQGEWVAFISSGTGTYAVHTPGDKRCEDVIKWTGFDGQENAENNARYIAAFNPEVVQALLDERERNQQYIKRRDQENEDIALTVGRLLIENGQLVADTLRHLADNEIDSDYFAITSTNENGTEIDHEMAITDYALQAAGTVDELVAALESAEKRIAELEAEPVSNSDELPLDYLQGHKDGLEWAAQLAEANHPQTGDWLYDDPIDLARAIRKGPDMPTVQAGNYPVTPDGWISCSERMPVIGELNWRTSFPLLVTCEIGVIPAYYGFVSVNGDRHYGFMESLKYGDDSGNHPQTNEYGLISNVTHWMPLPEPPF